MTAYSPPEYQKRASAREHHTKEIAELTRYTIWLAAELGYTPLRDLCSDAELLTDFIEEFLRLDSDPHVR